MLVQSRSLCIFFNVVKRIYWLITPTKRSQVTNESFENGSSIYVTERLNVIYCLLNSALVVWAMQKQTNQFINIVAKRVSSAYYANIRNNFVLIAMLIDPSQQLNLRIIKSDRKQTCTWASMKHRNRFPKLARLFPQLTEISVSDTISTANHFAYNLICQVPFGVMRASWTRDTLWGWILIFNAVFAIAAFYKLARTFMFQRGVK